MAKHKANSQIKAILDGLVLETQDLILGNNAFPIENLIKLVERIRIGISEKRLLAFMGNGGSAAEAMHLAAEFVGRCSLDHEPWRAMSLNENQSALTAIANDYGVESVFERMVKAHLVEGDTLIALSTSGRSKNILKGIQAALDIGVKVLLWTGDSTNALAGVEVWTVPSSSTPRIQEVHLMWGHFLAQLVEYEIQNP